MLVTPPFGASSNIALWRAYSKPPVELVVADLDSIMTSIVIGLSSVPKSLMPYTVNLLSTSTFVW